MGLPGHAAHQGEAPGGVALPLHLAADRLEVPNLMAWHCTYIGAIEHDDWPACCRATAWVRVRRLSGMRASSRNEACAPNPACTRFSSGVHRAVSNARTGGTVASAKGTGWRRRQTLNRGASTSTVPNTVCSRRVRRSLSGCSTPHAAQAR